jgi:N-hydroxyarylamine O-acetyltransferase
MHLIDLDAYFQRTGYTGSREPTLETLNAIHLAHITTFVFENLSNWTGRHVSLDLADIEEKFIRAKRGGYCFETNTLFGAVLSQLGYEVKPLVAWVQWMQPPEAKPTRTHMLLHVMIDGRPWIADVGFGSIGQTVPLALDTEDVQTTPHETRRYRFNGGTITHQVQLGPDEWADVYSFDLREMFPTDFEMANWFVSTHPNSLFRKTLLIGLPRKDDRLLIAFGEFTKRRPDGSAEKRPIENDEDLHHLLVHEFGLPADDPAVREASLAGPV